MIFVKFGTNLLTLNRNLYESTLESKVTNDNNHNKFVLLLHQVMEKNTHNNKTGTQNQHFTCQLNMSSMCPPAVALRSHSRRLESSITKYNYLYIENIYPSLVTTGMSYIQTYIVSPANCVT